MNYLYNGVELPALPDWNKEKYPFALLAHNNWINNTKRSVLTCFSQKPPSVYINESNMGTSTIVEIKEPFIEFTMLNTDSGWGEFTEYTGDGTANRSGIWSNADIYYDDGTLYLAASEPVPVCPSGMSALPPALKLSAYFLGRRIAGQRKRAPVAYLYNGVRLPKLPEWDRGKYPYVLITLPRLTSLGYRAVASQEPAFVDGNVIRYEFPWLQLLHDEETGWEDNWREMAEGAEANTALHSSKYVWANYDILDTDGAIFVSASDPVPVYE